jgi:hypothetical protein
VVIRKMDRLTMMRLTFPAWNADNLRAREAYYELLNDLEAPRLCQKKLHPRTRHGGCSKCRNERERRHRRDRDYRPYRGRLDETQKAEIVRRYTEDLESAKSVAEVFGVAMGTVMRVLVDSRIHIRDTREAYEALLERRRRADDTDRRQESA